MTTNAKDQLLAQLKERRDAKLEEAVEVLRKVAADQIASNEPAVGELVTMVVELGISETDVAEYLDVAAEVDKLQTYLATPEVQGHRQDWWNHKTLGDKLVSDFERAKREFGHQQAAWKAHLDTLERRDDQIVRAQKSLQRKQYERDGLERKFRGLPPAKPLVVNISPEERLGVH